MREDLGVNIVFVAVTVFTVLVSIRSAFWPGADDPNWELRWRSLDPGYRDWLAAMSTSASWMKTLTDPEEVQLTRGFARRESRRLSHFELAASAIFVIGLALVLAGVLAGSDATLTISVFYLLHALVYFFRRHQLRSRLTERSDSEAAPPRPSAQPA